MERGTSSVNPILWLSLNCLNQTYIVLKLKSSKAIIVWSFGYIHKLLKSANTYVVTLFHPIGPKEYLDLFSMPMKFLPSEIWKLAKTSGWNMIFKTLPSAWLNEGHICTWKKEHMGTPYYLIRWEYSCFLHASMRTWSEILLFTNAGTKGSHRFVMSLLTYA